MEELAQKAGAEFQAFNGRTYARCSNNFPSLFFLVDQKWLEVAANDYVIDVSGG